MSKLQERVERMEKVNSSSQGITAIFVCVLGADHGKAVELPILGWRYTYNEEVINVLRREGESDDQLKQRAESLARAPLVNSKKIPLLTQIFE